MRTQLLFITTLAAVGLFPREVEAASITRNVTVDISLSGTINLVGQGTTGPGAFSIGAAPEPLDDPIPERIQSVYAPLALETVVDGLTSPIWGTSAPGLPPWILYVVDQVGIPSVGKSRFSHCSGFMTNGAHCRNRTPFYNTIRKLPICH